MAYRGDATDPLENMINRRQGTNRVVLLLVVLWVLPYVLGTDLSVFKGVFGTGSSPSSAPIAAPTATAAPITSAAPGTKMSAATLEQLLRTAPASKRAPHDVHCAPLQTGWDYVCTYQADAPKPAWWKIGVRVSANAIVQASPPQPFERPLATP